MSQKPPCPPSPINCGECSVAGYSGEFTREELCRITEKMVKQNEDRLTERRKEFDEQVPGVAQHCYNVLRRRMFEKANEGCSTLRFDMKDLLAGVNPDFFDQYSDCFKKNPNQLLTTLGTALMQLLNKYEYSATWENVSETTIMAISWEKRGWFSK